jgi:hypothetical protein
MGFMREGYVQWIIASAVELRFSRGDGGEYTMILWSKMRGCLRLSCRRKPR